MRTNIVIACVLLAASSAGAQPGTGSGSGSAAPTPTTPPAPPTGSEPAPTPPAPTPPDPNAPPQSLGTPTEAPPVVIEPQPQPPPQPPAPPPTPPTPPAPEPKPESKPDTPSHWTQPRCKQNGDRKYYNCERGFGIFHMSRLVIGALSGDVATVTTDPATGTTMSSYGATTAGVLSFEASYLGIPSSFAPTNFHGMEFSTGLRTSPFDFWLQFGTGVTLLNLGSGGIGTLRIGGGFGAGFDLAHGYGYLRGRAAMIILPERLDIEVSTQWTPASASTDNFDVETYRLSAWWRLDKKKKRAVEVYVEKFSRLDADRDVTNPMYANDEEIVDGMGFGLGLSFF